MMVIPKALFRQSLVFSGSGASIGDGSVNGLLWAHDCVHSEKSAISLSLKNAFHRQPRLPANLSGWTRSDPAIYSIATSAMITVKES
jgi:hypothetical protein